eukprot:TRINITY_DN8591_c0_g2_i10.p1 TRINITY_DN8591_c0_g2~~TRINITY_DN8591_c0_g2_i10.p1  ORF type:complete len:107 (-),score=6.18 TRINITY_DN8591_c0_g2_i10:168-488(-)
MNALLSQLICTLQLSSQLYHRVHHTSIYHHGTTKGLKSPANGTTRVTFRNDVTATPITSPPKTILKASISTSLIKRWTSRPERQIMQAANLISNYPPNFGLTQIAN